ncbi:hypothetical protein NEOLEDRAFT_1158445 [Neolentinus lepideus HHB14362 ss-1]|uniref:RING-type domain-containing protein n=1 Tax=Neolentinus lepideus HHB14362 ss-1 TaxID=1314782 RepID=A0A165PCZ4_9AGAM|nr:hypothetical protein NEOLEDRAFT_1158445 [Neolentinus lepideus HHB14362 ss-1]
MHTKTIRPIHIVLHLKSDNTSSSQLQKAEAPFPDINIPASACTDTQATARWNALFNPHHKNYRFSPIRLGWVDFEDMSKAISAGKEKEQRNKCAAVEKFVPHTRMKTGFAKECIMMGVLALPSWMTPSDFLAFVAPAAEGIVHLQMIRNSAPNRSIVLIKFCNAEDAVQFVEAYNGKPFNSAELDDQSSLAISHLSICTYELPTCSVCLERMESAVTDLVTVPCSHTFNCMCLSQWDDSRCPVCRYSRTLLSFHPPSSSNRSTVPIPFTSLSTPGTVRLRQRACPLRTHELELETQRVWATLAIGLGPGPSDALTAEKTEPILNSQRMFCEEQSAELKMQVGELKAGMVIMSKEVEDELSNTREDIEQRKQEEDKRVAALEREKAQAEKRAVSEGLLKNLEMVKQPAEQGDTEKENVVFRVGELEDELRDSGGVEAAGGSIEPSTSSRAPVKKKKSRKT